MTQYAPPWKSIRSTRRSPRATSGTGRCDDDSAPLIVRKDDKEDVIRERLRTYEEVTRPVLNHYPSDRYFQISGDRSTSYIFEEITHILENVTGQETPA